MNYPYYIITKREGRLPCPPQYRGTVIAKEFTSGRIGGTRNVEHRTEDPQEAYAAWLRDRMNTTIYEVNMGGPRRRVRAEELQRKIKESRK